MCGIFGIFGNSCGDLHCQFNGNGAIANGNASAVIKNGGENSMKNVPQESFREMANRCSRLQRHRGPDKTGIVHFQDESIIMIHERLRIVGVAHGDQPLQSADGSITLVANGEIYNFRQIAEELSKFYKRPYVPRSDSDVIIGLYEKYGEDLVHHLTGMFAFVLYDRKKNKIFAARCPFGILSMYIGEDMGGNIWIASEMKCMVEKCPDIRNFPTGTKFFVMKKSANHIHIYNKNSRFLQNTFYTQV